MKKVNTYNSENSNLRPLLLYIFFWVFLLTNGFANPFSAYLLQRFNANPDYYLCGLAIIEIIVLAVGIIILVRAKTIRRTDIPGIVLLILYIITLLFALLCIGAVIWFQYAFIHADLSNMQLM